MHIFTNGHFQAACELPAKARRLQSQWLNQLQFRYALSFLDPGNIRFKLTGPMMLGIEQTKQEAAFTKVALVSRSHPWIKTGFDFFAKV